MPHIFDTPGSAERDGERRWRNEPVDRSPRLKGWRPAIAVGLGFPFFVFCLWFAVLWRFDLGEREPDDWRPVFAQAERLYHEGDLYQSRLVYSRLGRIAKRHGDWKGLLAAACGMKKIDGRVSRSDETHTFLLAAMMTAESKRSRTGLHAVATAFASVGETRLGAVALSRIETSWNESNDEEVSGAPPWDCWGARKTAASAGVLS